MATMLASALLYVQYYYQMTIAAFQLVIGRLLPTLKAEHVELAGKVVIVTGANSGIGLSLATSLAKANAIVYLACRNLQKGEDAAAQIVDSLSANGSSKRVHVIKLDTSSIASVHAFAKAWKETGRKIDILAHNAGISGSLEGSEVTADGLDSIYATNFIGSFLLTSLIESCLSADARVIFTTSFGQYGGDLLRTVTLPRHIGWQKPSLGLSSSNVYGDTKSMQVVLAQLLQERWRLAAKSTGNTRVAHSWTPGYTATPIFGKMEELPTFDPIWWALAAGKSLATPVEVGTATGVWLATTKDRAVADPANGGRYWDRKNANIPSAKLFEVKYGHGFFERLWDLWVVDSGAKWAAV